jgi:hypothetical protein
MAIAQKIEPLAHKEEENHHLLSDRLPSKAELDSSQTGIYSDLNRLT